MNELELELPDGTEFYIAEDNLQEIIEFMNWDITVQQFLESHSDRMVLLVAEIAELRN